MTAITIGPCKRLLLLGGGELALQAATWAMEQRYDVEVITAPRHAEEIIGFSGKTFAQLLNEKKLRCCVVTNIESEAAREAIGDCGETFAVSLGAAWIFRERFINEVFKGKLFNLHGSRLPQNRGGGGFSWQIMMGNCIGMCLLHLIDGGVDTGDIVAYREFVYPARCRTPKDYMDVYVEKNLEFLKGFVTELFAKEQRYKQLAQPEYLSTYWPRLHTPTHGWIDWSLPITQLERLICAFDDPYAGAITHLNGRPVHLKAAQPNFHDGAFHPFQAGVVYRKNDNWLCIAANGGALIVEQANDDDGKSILAEIKAGDRLCTPADKLHASAERVFYNPNGLKDREL
ncbi:MAG: hypothetical protein V4568_05200 [Pseudomonadota bacterium]